MRTWRRCAHLCGGRQGCVCKSTRALGPEHWGKAIQHMSPLPASGRGSKDVDMDLATENDELIHARDVFSPAFFFLTRE